MQMEEYSNLVEFARWLAGTYMKEFPTVTSPKPRLVSRNEANISLQRLFYMYYSCSLWLPSFSVAT